VIAGARVALVDPISSKVLAHVRADSSGLFQMSDAVPEGKYIVHVSSPGFATMRLPIVLGRASTCLNRVNVELGILGKCSKATKP
jgi:hypothetical protein